MTQLSIGFNKQLLDFFSSNGYREQRKFIGIETEKKRSCLASMGRFISVQYKTQNDILIFLLLLANVGC